MKSDSVKIACGFTFFPALNIVVMSTFAFLNVVNGDVLAALPYDVQTIIGLGGGIWIFVVSPLTFIIVLANISDLYGAICRSDNKNRKLLATVLSSLRFLTS